MESSGTQVQRKLSKSESIHSGHFMVSEIEENDQEKNKSTTAESDYEREEDTRILSNYEFKTKEDTQTYVYGSRSSSCVQIDSSLTKLFECMSLAYNGKITSPKWKTFKGLKLQIKDKIRLNNIIWRAWHIQYIAGRNPVVCQFSSSADSKRHKRTEAILLEGKYWKRRVDAVKAEYKKWRMYHRKGAGPQTPSRPSDFDWELSLPRWSNNLSNIDSLFSCEESADFFPTNYINAQSSFGNYYDYNSREIARSGMGAQFMQPGLEQLQPNVDFMDTFEPLHEAISRFHNNFALPTVQEESASFEANSKEEDLFSALFPPGNEQAAGSIQSDLSKPMLQQQQNTYTTQNIFQSHNEMLNLNTKMDSSSSLMVNQQQQQQQSQVATMQDSYDALGKIDLSGSYNFSSQQVQLATPSAPGAGGFASMSEDQSMPLSQVKSQMAMQNTLYSSANTSIGMVTMEDASVRSEQPIGFLSRFQAQNEAQQPQSSQQVVNIFQPDAAMLTMGYSTEQNMSGKAVKGKYFPSYYANSSVDKSTQNRSRSKSISMPHAKSVTIKSLLNKPSLVSTMSSSEGMVTTGATFRVPSQNDLQQLRTSSMERSISLPIYTQDRQRKTSSGGQVFLQRQQQQGDTTQSSQFEAVPAKSAEATNSYSFDATAMNSNFYPSATLSAATSPLSSHSSSYSNQDSQLLPQIANSSSQQQQQIRKVSQSSLDYIGTKLPEAQFGLAGMADAHSFSSGSTNPNSGVMSNLLQVNQRNVFSPHASASSSSSSPIGSLDTTKANVTGGNSLGSVSFALSNAQSQFGLLNKSTANRFKSADFKDHTLELKQTSKKPSNLFGSVEFGSAKEKTISDSLSNAFPTVDLSMSPVQKMPSRELSFKHLSSSSGPISPGTLSSLGLSLKSEDRTVYKERRRVCHINAEQKRRCNIKNGFDTLRNLLPSLSSNTNTKISKAAMLQKAADYIRILKNEKYEQQKEYEMLKQQVESLNQTISVFQNQLPATGAPVMGQRSSQIKEQYSDYVHNRTMQNWKFWVFSIIMESLLDSYSSTVATSNFEEMAKTLFRWLDQSCCLITLRRDVLNSLRFISTSTNILTSPEALPEEALLAVTNKGKGSNEDECHRKYSRP